MLFTSKYNFNYLQVIGLHQMYRLYEIPILTHCTCNYIILPILKDLNLLIKDWRYIFTSTSHFLNTMYYLNILKYVNHILYINQLVKMKNNMANNGRLILGKKRKEKSHEFSNYAINIIQNNINHLVIHEFVLILDILFYDGYYSHYHHSSFLYLFIYWSILI